MRVSEAEALWWRRDPGRKTPYSPEGGGEAKRCHVACPPINSTVPSAGWPAVLCSRRSLSGHQGDRRETAAVARQLSPRVEKQASVCRDRGT